MKLFKNSILIREINMDHDDLIPSNWIKAQLGEIVTFNYGKSLPEKHRTGLGFPVYGSNGPVGFHDTFLVSGPAIIIGRKGSIEVTWVHENCWPIDTTFYVVPKVQIGLRFCYYILKHLELKSLSRSTTIPGLNRNDAYRQTIFLPPSKEQERIVKKLDNMLNEIDAIRKRLNAIATFQEKLLGTFTRDEEGKSYPLVKLDGLIMERREQIGSRWANIRRIGISNTAGIIDLQTGKTSAFNRYKIVRKGDIIYNTMRINIGSIAIYRAEDIAITSPDYVVFHCGNKISSELLVNYLKSPAGMVEVAKNVHGSVRSRLYFKNLCSCTIPLGPQNIQDQATLLFTDLAIIMSRGDKVSNIVSQLEKTLYQKAFSGELTPQCAAETRFQLIPTKERKIDIDGKIVTRRKKMLIVGDSIEKVLWDQKSLPIEQLYQLIYPDDKFNSANVENFYLELCKLIDSGKISLQNGKVEISEDEN